MMYLVTNRLSASLLIDDIGVRLEPGSSKELFEHTYNSSRKLKEYEHKKWVSVSVRAATPKKSIPVWPFSAVASPVSTPVSVPAVVTAVQSPDSSILQGLVARLENLIGNLQTRAVTVGSAPSAVTHSVIDQPSDEPMFIPEFIIPKSANVSINVDTSESDRHDYESGVEALKNARKKK